MGVHMREGLREASNARALVRNGLMMHVSHAMHRYLSLIHISEPTRPLYISYAVFCL